MSEKETIAFQGAWRLFVCTYCGVDRGEGNIQTIKKNTQKDAVNSLGFGQIRIRRYLLRYSG